MAVTMKDIAAASGVSRPMVSLVLNGRAGELRIAESTRQKVLKVAEELGYCRNQLARSVVTGQSRILAFVTYNSGPSSYIGRIQAGILNAASTANYSIKLHYLNDDDEQLLRSMREWQVSGVIFHVVNYSRIARFHQELDKLGIPVALVNLFNQGQTGFGVTTDDASGAYAATMHLIAQGAGKVACISNINDPEYVKARERGYRQAIREKGLKPLIFKWGTSSEDDLAGFFREKGIPDAVFGITDMHGLMVMRWAYKNNIKVPEQLKVAGFGDLDMGLYSLVPLTSVHQEYEQMGYEAADAVIKAVENKDAAIRSQAENKMLPTELIIRQSSLNYTQLG